MRGRRRTAMDTNEAMAAKGKPKVLTAVQLTRQWDG
jgi:hypothetical protein